MGADFALRVDWHLRAAPAQCELSDQEVATPQAPRLTGGIRQMSEPSADGAGGGGKGPGRKLVSATAGQAQDQRDLAERLGFKPGQVVQEIGYDDDCDEKLRDSVAAVDGVELVDEDYGDVVDVVLLWWRDDDGDLVDALVDALTPLTDGGYIWLLTPKSGRSGHVEPSEIGEAAPTAGLSQTSTISAGRDWSASRLVAPKARR
jgi:hypothetical protein